ncbi:MAG: SMP-30/gluconolactonase/LRE family protein [Deltaproteobacteria bacterium]|jgi:DNA-binding beta-propeller fold protein YncE|nr:SMP-30/gluconolactonase/LRE family protein [Deltaproteobacteria bacterium]
MLNSTRISLIIVVLVALGGNVFAADDMLVKKNAAVKFAALPAGVVFPEGIAANPYSGDIYVSTFDFGGNNKILRFGKNGKLQAQRDFGVEPLLGLAFNSQDNKVYICNPAALVGGQCRIQRIDAGFDETTTVEEVALIPIIGPPPDRVVGNPDGSQDLIEFGNNAAAPNALAFDSAGNLYVSDSFQGAIFRIDDAANCSACPVTTVKHDGLLATAGFPPFGANGIALGGDEAVLYVANTGDDRILMLDLATGEIEVFAESINGADGIAIDATGHLWVAANQADQIVVLNEDGRVIAKLGEFLGIRSDGSARGLLFPASILIQGKWLYTTNLALPLTPAAGDEPEENITKFTVSRIKIPINVE